MNLVQTIFKYYLYSVVVFFLGRLTLFLINFEAIRATGVDYWMTFLYGLRMDTIVASMFLVIPTLLLSFSPKRMANFVNIVLKYYFVIVLGLFIYIENATLPFLAQYDVRPNYLFVEYLIYPKEVFGMIFAEYKIELAIAFSMIVLFVVTYLKHAKNDFLRAFKTPYLGRVALFLPIALLLFIGIRSSFGHRPANPSDAMYTSNRMVNELTKNSVHSILYAVYANQKHGSKNIQKYGKMDTTEAIARAEKLLHINPEDKKLPFTRLEKTHFKSQKTKNLVIFIEESLGAQFVGSLGGEKGITPSLDKLASESILFSELYSNGTRSIRGLAGLSAGNLAVPGKGVLKRNKSQKDFFTIAAALKSHGYHTSFLYGGESRFDNMKSWYVGNGFDEIIDQEKFEHPTFTSSWGVCDEDLVLKANEEFKKLHAKGEKFATVMFSQSNHSPFHYPENKITPLQGSEKHSVKNAVKYADYAIGKFFELAKKEKYYEDTVFVVVADHNVRVYGNDLVPVDMFRIPAVIHAKGLKPRVYNHLATQPDVLATALDLIGVDLRYPIMGHSIFSDAKADVALMQFHDSYALRVKDKVAVVQPDKEAQTFEYRAPKDFLDKDNHLKAIEHDVELEKDALALVYTLDYLYQNRLYQ